MLNVWLSYNYHRDGDKETVLIYYRVFGYTRKFYIKSLDKIGLILLQFLICYNYKKCEEIKLYLAREGERNQH